MKDNRFIELLNLYIDRQISPIETAELEAEIQGSPKRQKIYRQYCQMHRGTKLVYESFRAEAGARETAAGGAVITHIERQQRRRHANWAYYAGGLAAAACLTFVVARVDFSSTTTTAPSRSTELAAASVVAPAPLVKGDASPVRATMVSLETGLPVEPDYPTLIAALRQQERALAENQFSNTRLQSLFDDGVFENRQLVPQGSQRIFRGRGANSQQPAVEFTAFQFQR